MNDIGQDALGLVVQHLLASGPPGQAAIAALACTCTGTCAALRSTQYTSITVRASNSRTLWSFASWLSRHRRVWALEISCLTPWAGTTPATAPDIALRRVLDIVPLTSCTRLSVAGVPAPWPSTEQPRPALNGRKNHFWNLSELLLRDLDLTAMPSKALQLPHLQRLDIIACSVPSTWWAPLSGRAARLDRLARLKQLCVRRLRLRQPDGGARLSWKLPGSLQQLAFQQQQGSWELDASAARRLTWLQVEGADVRTRLPPPPALGGLQVWRGATPAQMLVLSGWRWRAPQLPALRELAIGGRESPSGGDEDDDDDDGGGGEGADDGVGAGGGGGAAHASWEAAGADAPGGAAAAAPLRLAGSWEGELMGGPLLRALSVAARHAPGLRTLTLRAGLLDASLLRAEHLAPLRALEALHLNAGLILMPGRLPLQLQGLPSLRLVTAGRLHAACKITNDSFSVPKGTRVLICRQPTAAQVLTMNPCRPRGSGRWASHSGALFPPPPPPSAPPSGPPPRGGRERAAAAAAAAVQDAPAAAPQPLAAARRRRLTASCAGGGTAGGGVTAVSSGGGSADCGSDAGSLDIGSQLGLDEPWYAPDPRPGELPDSIERYCTGLGLALACGCWSCVPRRVLYQLRPWHPCEVTQCVGGTLGCAAVIAPSFVVMCAVSCTVGVCKQVFKGAKGAFRALLRPPQWRLQCCRAFADGDVDG